MVALVGATTCDIAPPPLHELQTYCSPGGPACGQSPRAIRGLLDAGYPGDKIRYYRGGMQMWQLWGLTTVVPQQ